MRRTKLWLTKIMIFKDALRGCLTNGVFRFVRITETGTAAKELSFRKDNKEGITFISPEQLKAIEESPEELDKLKRHLINC